MSKGILKFFKYYFPALIFMGVIFYFSSIPFLRYSKNITWEIILRKFAHFVEYSVLTLLIWRVFSSLKNLNFKKKYLLTLILVLFFAISDELHQLFIPGRAGMLFDVIFDLISSFIALEIIQFFKFKKRRIKIVLIILLGFFILGAMIGKMIWDKEKEEEKKIFQEKFFSEKENETKKETEEKNDGQIREKNQPKEEFQKKETSGEKLPEKVFVKVPFTSQAPYAKWDELHEEACEEASLIMIKYYLDGRTLNKEIAEKEIQNLVAYEKEKYIQWKDFNVQEIVKLADDYYGIKNLKVIYDFNAEDLKKYLAQEKPIIIPAAGRLLGNPNFTPPGPLYHNLVLVGYDGDIFITNDPGTRKGEGYRYNLKNLYNAIHDFPGKKEEIEEGRKAMIVIE